MPERRADRNALELFADWLADREQGERVEFEMLLHNHPQLAAELAELHATWRALAAASDPGLSSQSLHERLQSRFGKESVPDVALRAQEEGAAREDFNSALIAQLSSRSTGFGRYRIRGEVARGGMGAILKIWDEDLHRHLAMKVILGQAGAPTGGDTPPVESSKVARFLEEAQVTGQLDHPGIVPVHELGLDPDGRLYFTMKLVKGRSLKEIFDLVAAGAEGWTQTKALGVLLKVCEAMAYAHDKGVIHRDLKPANVMVGKFGEVHVMDWGLARILDRPEVKDIRISEKEPRSTILNTERDQHRGETPESPLYTMDGDVVGTPAYMPPEQAAGRIDEVGPHSDVYALGAMIYHLLAGHPPYVPANAKLDNVAIWDLVRQSPPTPITLLAPDTPAELVAICDKAMARDWKQRYRDTSELATDLSAYLERRVVRAYETGAWAEARKWVERNKALAASVLAVVVLLTGGAGLYAWQSRAQNEAMSKKNGELTAANTLAERNAQDARDQATKADAAKQDAQDQATRADAAKREAEANLADVLRLADLKRVRDLQGRAKELWPAWPELVPEIKQWIKDAKELVGRLDVHRASLAKLREKALPADAPEDLSSFTAQRRKQEQERRREDLARLDAELSSSAEHIAAEVKDSMDAELKHAGDIMMTRVTEERAAIAAELQSNRPAGAGPRERVWRFANDDADTQWRHNELAELVAAIEALQAPITMSVDVLAAWKLSGSNDAPPEAFAPSGDATIAAMQRRIDHAVWVEDASLNEAADAWREAIARIQKNPKYSDFAAKELKEQFGLVPIGPDPDSGLEEFYDVETGLAPHRDATGGHFAVQDATAMVFVLVPGGTFTMGRRTPDPGHPIGSPYVDPGAYSFERLRDLTLAPFFISKFEMTQAQWLRVAGHNPSWFQKVNGATTLRPLTSPVENVSWTTCHEQVERLGLRLPSEAQWEYSARAGTTTCYWCGDLNADVNLKKAGNVFDRAAKAFGYPGDAEPWNDGFADVAPVGSFTANAFGLHDVIGNVGELCDDEYLSDLIYRFSPPRPGDGERSRPLQAGTPIRVQRGFGWLSPADNGRSGLHFNNGVGISYRNDNLGLRPARSITW